MGLDIFALQMRLARRQQLIEDLEEFVGMVIAFVMRQENAVTGEFLRASPDDDIQKQTSV